MEIERGTRGVLSVVIVTLVAPAVGVCFKARLILLKGIIPLVKYLHKSVTNFVESSTPADGSFTKHSCDFGSPIALALS